MDFGKYLINYGCLGIITHIGVDLVPAYMIMKSIYQNLTWETLFAGDNFDNVMKKNDYISFFFRWNDRVMDQVWLGNKYQIGEYDPEKQETYLNSTHIKDNCICPIEEDNPERMVKTGPGRWDTKLAHYYSDEGHNMQG